MRTLSWAAGGAIVAGMLAASAWGDEPIEWTVATQLSPLSGPRYEVAGVDGGTVRLKSAAAYPDRLNLIVGGVAEGHYLMIARDARKGAAPAVLRVEVAEVGADGSLTLSLAPEAAGKLKVGDRADLARPFGSTTAQIRALPPVIPFPRADDGQGGDPLDAARQAQARQVSTNNLKQITLALHNFHSVYNCLPPAVIFGPDGKPWHSWRVLILPYLDQQALYQQYDFGQPWDSEKNRKVLEQMPAVFRDPIHGDLKGHVTHYAGLLGTNTAFSPDGPEMKSPRDLPIGPKAMGFRDFTDGTSNTLLVVPADPKAEIPWTKPEDILVLPEFPGLGKPGGIAAPYHENGKKDGAKLAPVAYCDGSVRMIADTIRPEVLSALMTRNGGEVVGPQQIPGDNVRAGNPNNIPTLVIRIEGGKATATLE